MQCLIGVTTALAEKHFPHSPRQQINVLHWIHCPWYILCTENGFEQKTITCLQTWLPVKPTNSKTLSSLFGNIDNICKKKAKMNLSKEWETGRKSEQGLQKNDEMKWKKNIRKWRNRLTNTLMSPNVINKSNSLQTTLCHSFPSFDSPFGNSSHSAEFQVFPVNNLNVLKGLVWVGWNSRKSDRRFEKESTENVIKQMMPASNISHSFKMKKGNLGSCY